MFRAALLSIIFSLAVGPDVTLLCRTWCDAHLAAASECHHRDSPYRPSVAGNQNCDNVVVAATAVLRDDIRRDVSPQGANQASPVPRYKPTQSTIDACPGEERWHAWLVEKRPLVTALRI